MENQRALALPTTLRLFLKLPLPASIVGGLGLLAIGLSLYFSIGRRDGHNALFCICLGWLLVVLDVVYAYPSEAIRIYATVKNLPPLQDGGPMNNGVFISPRLLYVIRATCQFLGRLVPPLLLTIPAAWWVLRPEHAESLRKNRLRVAATMVAVADGLLVLFFYTGCLGPDAPRWAPPRLLVFRALAIFCFLASLYFFLARRDGDSGIGCLFAGWASVVLDVTVRLLISLDYLTASMDFCYVNYHFAHRPVGGMWRLTDAFGTPLFGCWALLLEFWHSLLLVAIAISLAAVAAWFALSPRNVQGVVRGRRWIVASVAGLLYVVVLFMFMILWSEPIAFQMRCLCWP